MNDRFRGVLFLDGKIEPRSFIVFVCADGRHDPFAMRIPGFTKAEYVEEFGLDVDAGRYAINVKPKVKP